MNLTATRQPDGSVLLEWDLPGRTDIYRDDGFLVGDEASPFTDDDPPDAETEYRVVVHQATTATALIPALPQQTKWARSVPGSTTVVNWALANPHLFHAGDAIGLLTGGGPTGIASPSWVNQQAVKLQNLRADGVTIFAQVSGTKDVDTIARQCKANIDAVALVQETGFGVESEPWDPSQSATEARIKKAKGFCDWQGVDLILHMSGKGVPWRSDDIPTWDYSRFAAIVGDTFPNVTQHQRDYQSDYESNNGRVEKALRHLAAQTPTWLTQVTLDKDEVNGITHNKPGDPAKAALDLIEKAIANGAPKPAGISLWCLDAGPALGAFMAETAGWTL